MKTLLLLALLVGAHALSAADTPTLDEPLQVLHPFIGKTWRGAFKDSTPENPVIDIARWERALNGRAVRVLHAINDGVYGGETLIRWDAASKRIVYFYFSTAGFMTSGTMTVAGRKITATEKVMGNADGLTEVRSTLELRDDGTLVSNAEYLKDGVVTGGREVVYREAPGAEVKFR